MILKLDERAARVRFEISSMILRPKLNDKKFNYRFITAVLKLQNSVSTTVLLI